MKRIVARILSACLLIGALTIPAAATSSKEIENDVECVLEMVSRKPGSEYAWNCEGKRESRLTTGDFPRTEERVSGWSTCYDKFGEEAIHYTHSRYERAFIGSSEDSWSSGRVWGTGKVYAYSPYLSYSVAQELQAKVYYGR